MHQPLLNKLHVLKKDMKNKHAWRIEAFGNSLGMATGAPSLKRGSQISNCVLEWFFNGSIQFARGKTLLFLDEQIPTQRVHTA